MTKKAVGALLLLLLTAVFLGGCGKQSAIGVIDVNKIMSDSPKIKTMQEQLNTKGKELSDQLDKDKASLSPEEFNKKQEAAYGDFQKTKQDLESQIDADIKQSLEQIAKEKDLGVVIYKNSIAQGGIDITDDVLKRIQ
ncbi:MAG: OmpH family outer membrane protein [Sporomusaceae bacterium]|nr:OmpH family outer membrane protein [Sporomusaceae bacterium]